MPVKVLAIYGLVDPDLRTLEIFSLIAEHWTLLAVHKDNVIVSQAPFEAIEFSLKVLWCDCLNRLNKAEHERKTKNTPEL